ncbi:MAG TPA: TerB family tellurite resistance protein [Colwellia sp.]|nr:TerB family tellurite resistance protein [Colwellia sp.]
MLNKISAFFNELIEDFQTTTEQQKNTELSLEICCAVLLCEVMRADSAFTEEEQDALSVILTTQFNLTAQEVNDILVKALELSENASDFHQFTSRINQHYSLNQRIKIVTLLWKVAYADGELANIETHIIRKIADLLHLRHNEYIATKIAAEEFHIKNEKK